MGADMSCAESRKGIPLLGGESTSVVFFPDPAMPCKAFMKGEVCQRKNCVYSHEPTSLSILLKEIRAAKKTLDICVFTITCDKISDEVKDVAKRGVIVRIICDDEQAAAKGSDIGRLSRTDGISVRHDGDVDSNMHHKFCIIDGETLLNGSFNWTKAAVTTNCENVTITKNSSALLKTFSNEFNRLWTKFAANTDVQEAESSSPPKSSSPNSNSTPKK